MNQTQSSTRGMTCLIGVVYYFCVFSLWILKKIIRFIAKVVHFITYSHQKTDTNP
uniref:Uncharacterized protein n=1 Tax=Lepeophtheirus salmonis TaxID=72036 RepID=A0A0K2UX30_LEPSM